jgi:hypothetical protein
MMAGSDDGKVAVSSIAKRDENSVAATPHPTGTHIWPKATTVTKRKPKNRRRKNPRPHQQAAGEPEGTVALRAASTGVIFLRKKFREFGFDVTSSFSR